MSEKEWELLETVSGSLQAELLKGMLEAEDITVIMMQEGVGHSVYALNVGPLSEVQILVPANQLSQARQVLDEYYRGAPTDQEEPVS